MELRLSTQYHARVFNDIFQGHPTDLVLSPGDRIQANCWAVGSDVGSSGDVWYHTAWAFYAGSWHGMGDNSWTFAPFVDGAAAFHDVPGVPHC